MERALLERVVCETGAAQKHGETVFLCDPYWSASQRERFKEISQMAKTDELRRWANRRRAQHTPSGEPPSMPTAKRHVAAAIWAEGRCPTVNHTRERGWLAIPTGGSSGGLKFALHDEQTLGAAVRGFCAHFGVARVNAVDCLPPWHVSGLMARLRCAATGGVHVPWEWKRLEAGEFPKLPTSSRANGGSASVEGGAGGWFLSLVPTQLQRLLKQGEAATSAVARAATGAQAQSATRVRAEAARDWLRQFHAVFIGGGPLWSSLADEAAEARLPIVLSYGMTETGAMVVAQRPGDFAAGDRSSGVPMPHAQISINGEELVCVRGESIMRGYFGVEPCNGIFTTADLGRIDEVGRLHILGRCDEVAISGGEKVRLGEVEAALRGAVGDQCSSAGGGESGFEDVAVLAVPDAEWGEMVVACYLNADAAPLSEAVIEAATHDLARHQRPKRWLAFSPEEWPRNAQGKLNRAALREAVLARLKPQRSFAK